MWKNYLLIALRNLVNNKTFAAVNIFGLVVGMTAFLLIMQYVLFERSYEAFHKNADNIFRLTLDIYNGKEYVVTDCETHQGIGPLLKETAPEVVDYVRMMHNDGRQSVRVNDRQFLDEGIYYADQSAFSVFTLNTLHGNPSNALTDPGRAVLTRASALRYFGKTDAVGQSFRFNQQNFTVSAVIDDVPYNTHLKFNLLLSHATLTGPESKWKWYKESVWNGNNEYTYLLMQPGTDLEAFNIKLRNLSASLKQHLDDDQIQAEYIGDIHLHSTKSFEPEAPGNAKTVFAMLGIAILIISLASVNYINLSTARAIDRSREVGIRKVMGSVRRQLIAQFLCESFIVNLTGAAIALACYYAALPLFSGITGIPVDGLTGAPFWMVFAGLIVIGSLLSGFYPAFILSSFSPVSVLKGKFRSSIHGQAVRKVLVTFQFAATVVLLVGIITVFNQITHLRNYDLGFKPDQTLVLRAPYLDIPDSVLGPRLESFRNELRNASFTAGVASSESVPGLSLHELSTTSGVRRMGAEKTSGSYNYYHFSIDEHFISSMNMELLAGRNFAANAVDQLIINQECAERLGFGNYGEAVGTKLDLGGGWTPTVIGVVKNFYQRSPKEPHLPMFFRYGANGMYISVALNSDQMTESLAVIKALWDKAFPEAAFHYFFLDQNYAHQYTSDVRIGMLITVFTGVAVVIAGLGLFGLSSYTIVQRTKEIAVRKVLGASVNQIATLLSGEFVVTTLLASVLALPLAYFAMDHWLSTYAVRIELQAWFFVLPVIAILFVTLFIVSFQIIRTALANPSDSLKHE